ncbi:CDP-diacylglycerol--serine O-phosphatidyltransferase [Candidatus Kuenenia stuttgartiensis]|uniref:CDP-diacylglycerol--serine O-phosphatidyltransferase n=1 Tax=Kuenenia stuttgartiensis TaxID=174633 RepID=UPI00146CD93C|nr:CDP-diacylglycerol--serine O-phosphatidyltransferase [Candidatus Kuenenia stuttgartiensis]
MKIKQYLPTVLTMGNIMCGFLSIMCVLNQRLEIAAWLIIVAMILDGFDGKLARLMNTASKTGAQLDSMADLVAFGIAPAVLMTKMCNNSPIVISWGFGLFFMMCTAYRLARFNAQKEEAIQLPRHFSQVCHQRLQEERWHSFAYSITLSTHGLEQTLS